MVTKKLFNSREEWLQGRKNHIGGSDAAACVGLNPYKDNVQLWEEKVGLVLPEDISDKDYVQYGTEAEEHLRALFALDHPEYKVFYDPDNMFTNSKYPWMHASLDGSFWTVPDVMGSWRSRPQTSFRVPSGRNGGIRSRIITSARYFIIWQ